MSRWPLAVLLWAGLVATGLAQDRVAVRLDGREVIRVGPTEDATAAERARRIESRLTRLRHAPGRLPDAVVQEGPRPGERVISIGGSLVATVTPDDAADERVDQERLARRWARALDEALRLGEARRRTALGRFAAEVHGALRTAFGRLGDSALAVVPRVLAALAVLAGFWAVAALVRRALHVFFRVFIRDRTLENLIRQVAYYSVWGLGLVLALHALGFEPGDVVAGLGLTGLVLGFALKDVLSNFVSGIILLISRPFDVDDQIVVGDTEGAVVRIALRATEIRTYDGRLVLVPNAQLLTSRITNNTASPVRRGRVELPVGYDVDLGRAAAVMQAAAAATAGVLPEPPPSVRTRELGPDDVIVEVRYWTDSRRSDYVATESAVRDAVVRAFREAGLPLPEPDARFLAPLRRPGRPREDDAAQH